MTAEMTHEENFITAIIAQAIDDCIYDGTVEYKLQHKMDASNWIFGRHPEFMNYCKNDHKKQSPYIEDKFFMVN